MFSRPARTIGFALWLAVAAVAGSRAESPASVAGPFKALPEFQVRRRVGAVAQGVPADVLASGLSDELTGIFEAHFALPGVAVQALTAGPDGRLYFICPGGGESIPRAGEEPLRVQGEGAVLRCEPDGSHLEVFCRGLRPSHGLAFDNVGNLFTVDDGTGEDDQGRWLNLVGDGDYGWRTGWSRAALEPARTPWLAEKLWHSRFDGQAAWVLPPVVNVPARGFAVVHYPGTGFNARYDDHFFISNPARGTIFFWSMRPNGAAFLVIDKDEACSGAPVWEMAFRPGGRLDFACTDGRPSDSRARADAIYALSPANPVPDPQVEEVDRLLGGELKRKVPIDWRGFLKHPDQRVRLEAEWLLAASPTPDAEIHLRDVALGPFGGPEPPIARLHGIWGLGIRARRAEAKTPGAGVTMVEPLVHLLEDEDLEVRAQAASVLGDLRVTAAFDGLIRMLRNPEERVSMFAALALAKLGNRDALPQLILMLRDAGDHDPNLRHAYVEALVGLQDFGAIEEAAREEASAVRMGALLAMRRLHREEIARFLQDPEPALVLEAARAIHDESIAGALPPLAALIEKPSADDALMVRVLNANFRVGGPENAKALADFAAREDASEALRIDALRLLGLWPHPPENDYVTGAKLMLGPRDSTPAREALEAVMGKLNGDKSAKVAAAASAALEVLRAGGK